MNLRYLLVDVDGVGSFGSQPWEQIRTLVGPEGPVRVRLHPELHLAGWVNDVGLLNPETYPRNVVGSVLLGCCGARQQPYAGPVVVTGWDPHATWRGQSEVRGMADAMEGSLAWLLSDIRKALGYEPGVPTGGRRGWNRDVLIFAEFVKTAPSPTARTVTGDLDELLAMLRDGGVR